MSRRAENIFFAEGLNGIKNNVDKMVVCSQEPTTYAEANSTYALASVAMASGDFTIADGDVSGRKITVAQKTVTGSASGTGTHIALIDTINSNLYYVTTMTSVGISNGQNQDLKAFDIELQDPQAP